MSELIRRETESFGIQNIPNASVLRPSRVIHTQIQSQSRPNNAKANQFRQKIITKIGEPLFKKIYDFVNASKRSGNSGVTKNVDLKDAEIGG